jgi:hypothetical protein
MKVTRAQLKKTIDLLRSLDAASPYFGLQWTDTGLAVYRSSNVGQVYSTQYEEAKRPVVVSISHLAASLEAVRADEFEVIRGNNDSLFLKALGEHSAEMRIHTVRDNTPWRKRHIGGAVAREFDPKFFAGIDIHPFTVSMEPVIKGNKLMLVTSAGIVMRHGLAASAYPYPRTTFLRAIAGREIDRLFITVEGYWGAITDGYEILVAGHRGGDPLFDKYNLPLETSGEIPAAGLVFAMASAARWADKSARITFDAKRGVIATQDEQHNAGEFSFGSPVDWPSFSVDYPMLRLLYDTLTQSAEDTIKIVKNEGDTLRIARGPWEANLRVFR